MTFAFYLILMAVFNHARGSRFWNQLNSTTITRLLATLGMATATAYIPGYLDAPLVFCCTWPTLFLWSLFGWDAYWSAMIGHDPNHSKLWGACMMAIRMLAGVPAIASAAWFTDGNIWWALALPLLDLPYLFFGMFKSDLTIPRSEYADGALLGLIFLLGMN